MSKLDIRAVLYRVVPIAAPVLLWGVELHSQELQTWDVDLDAALAEKFADGKKPSLADCHSLCGTEAAVDCSVQAGADKKPQLECVGPTMIESNGFHNGTGSCSCGSSCIGHGRCPSDLERLRCERLGGCAGIEPAGVYLAHVAYLEAASVHAFRTLARQLRRHHAPARLITAARRAARDEIRHARTMRRLAAARGVATPNVRLRPASPQTLEALAIENVREGCIGETYGAALARWQAQHAASADLRTALRNIAEEETQHAELAWELAAWLEIQLSPAALQRVEQARREAAAELLAASLVERPVELTRELGLPSTAQTNALVRTLQSVAWS